MKTKKIEIGIVATKNDLVREAIEKIAATTGFIKPAAVLESAASAASPLHDYFNWDDGDAAHKFRLIQAGMLIRRIRIEVMRPATEVTHVEYETTRAFISPPAIRGVGSYMGVQEVMQDETLKKDMLGRAKRDLIALKSRYSDLLELSRIWEIVEAL